MKAQIIQIGNSQGVRIPKALLVESGISGEVDLVLHEDGILIRKAGRPRSNWDEIFVSLEEKDDDLSLNGAEAGNFERREWQW
ncbi:MAG: AbrB/MazE/SpoVT family DNA-binding domain-containing protein [Pyrinomonadaceae bacterium]